MNIYQCQKKAIELDFDNSQFIAMFPAGPKKCKWLDAYMGIFTIDADGLRDGFVTVGFIDSHYPDLVCTEPYVEEKA